MTQQRHVAAQQAHLGVAVVVALAATAGWVGLSNLTGLNHHFFPLVIAAAPGMVAGFLRDDPLSLPEALAASLVGLALVAAGWGALAATGDAPSATFIHGQPGGAPAEAALLAGLGALTGLWQARGRRTPS